MICSYFGQNLGEKWNAKRDFKFKSGPALSPKFFKVQKKGQKSQIFQLPSLLNMDIKCIRVSIHA